MELSDIDIILAVVRSGKISQAAKELNYAQSNVTTRIKKLEQEYQVQLFNRFPKGVVLTSKGEQFVQYATRIRDLLNDLEQDMTDPGEPSGTLKIGIVETAASSRFMEILNEYQVTYPAVSISLVNATSPKVLRKKIQEYEIDGAFISGACVKEGLKVEYEMQDTVHIISKRMDVPPESLCQVSWVVFPKGCPYREITEEYLQEEGLSARNMIEVSTMDNLLSCVESGIAFTIMPCSVIHKKPDEFSVHDLAERFTHTTTTFVRGEDRYVSSALDRFVKLLNQKCITF
ncbi:LysR family transcriptional regulator [Paenibacillus taichungensis]|uniref:LysR family transcriptional regulator n=1 Tax=Paenibacillus taichungensis TaxID=484184 RepID=A0A329QK77_9BACL|nr:LysR family transcriptional regulator [Paenibacillus taichungensis]RAW12301.1 LysR family transcriptional regulator [Paenibacillus taichungensis]